MRIGYFADGPWAHRAFQKIIADSSLEIVFLTVRYDKRDEVLLQWAKERGIPIELSRNINSQEFIEAISKYQADLFVSMSFNQIFKEQMINLPKYKTINCHAGKLPFYRGRNILNWALINDEKEFGVTAHYVDEGIDTGDIIVQETYPITDDDNYGTLLARAYEGCADVLYRAIVMIQNNEVKRIRQQDIDLVGMYCGGRQSGDEIINWNSTSRELFNFVRALSSPGPRATTSLNGKNLFINHVREIPSARPYINIPGQVLQKSENGFYVKTKDTFIEVLEYEYEGKIRVGDRLGGGFFKFITVFNCNVFMSCGPPIILCVTNVAA